MTCQEAIDVMGEAIEDRLAADMRPGFDEHMAECRPCATYFDQLRFTRGALRGLPRERAAGAHRDDLLRRFRERYGRKSEDT